MSRATGQKILTRRDRISGLAASSGGLAAQSAASWLLSCGEGCFIELEPTAHGQKFLPQRNRILCSWLFPELAPFLGGRALQGGSRAQTKKSYRGAVRILGLVAFQETWLHRTRFPASFLWWGMACRAWAGHRQKILPWRSRILGLVASSGGLATQNALPGFFSVVRDGL